MAHVFVKMSDTLPAMDRRTFNFWHSFLCEQVYCYIVHCCTNLLFLQDFYTIYFKSNTILHNPIKNLQSELVSADLLFGRLSSWQKANLSRHAAFAPAGCWRGGTCQSKVLTLPWTHSDRSLCKADSSHWRCQFLRNSHFLWASYTYTFTFHQFHPVGGRGEAQRLFGCAGSLDLGELPTPHCC